MSMQPAFAGIDVAFAKGKRLPVVVCTWRGNRLVPEALRRLPFEPPVGLGNARSCIGTAVETFAGAAAEYLMSVQSALQLRIVRIGIDAPSAARLDAIPRRLAEAALDAAGISCFTTPSVAEFSSIRLKVERHLASGGHENDLPHANQLWMQAGFALFRRLGVISECLEVYPQATVRQLGAGAVHKLAAGGLDGRLAAVAACTGWPGNVAGEPGLSEIAWGSGHDRFDAYLSAWVAALDVTGRVAYGAPLCDVIWAPRIAREIASKHSALVVFQNSPKGAVGSRQKPDRTRRPRQCPACPAQFKDFPLGWDAHAAHKCSGLTARDPESKKREYKERFGYLFTSGKA